LDRAPVFAWLARRRNRTGRDRVFNMGIGLAMVVSPHYAESIRNQLADSGLESWVIGRTMAGERGVEWAS
jgi:phosphoribosylaminoimidazole (AIR) synthetase